MTPQEAVDLVTHEDWRMRMISGDKLEMEIWGSGWNMRIAGKLGTGFALRFPQDQSWNKAMETGQLEWCELSTLECRRIVNFVKDHKEVY